MTLIRAFLRNETGATAVEYGLILAFIALIILSSMRGIGTKLNAKFQGIANNLG